MIADVATLAALRRLGLVAEGAPVALLSLIHI